MQNIYKNSTFRFLKAYRLTLFILARYLFLFGLARIFGSERLYGVFERCHHKTAQKIVKSALELKGLYIKIGQTLSIMSNFLPEAFTKELEGLQDAIPPHPFESIVERFHQDLKKSPHEICEKFEKTPIASASLGQVHIAYLKDGTKLAVKLQYPHIDKIVKEDLKTIKRIFGLLHFIFPHYGLNFVYEKCSEIIRQELDYKSEAHHLESIQKNFSESSKIIFPKVYHHYSSEKILTTEFIDGIKVTHIDELKKAGINPHDVAISLIHTYCKQIFIDGYYHADPHPGNIIIKPVRSSFVSVSHENTAPQISPQITHQIAMIDYGAAATISPQMKEGMAQFVEGVIRKDVEAIAQAMKQMGFVAREENEQTFEKIVDYFYSKIRGIKINDFRNLNLGDFHHLNDVFELNKMDISFKDLTKAFHVPKDWILLDRTLLVTLGIVSQLDPKLNPVDIILPYVEEFVLGKDKNVGELIVETTKSILLSYLNLPTEIRKTLKKLNEGQLSLSNKETKKQTEKIYSALHQLIYSFGIMGTLFMSHTFNLNGNTLWALRAEWTSLGLSLLLIISLIKNRK